MYLSESRGWTVRKKERRWKICDSYRQMIMSIAVWSGGDPVAFLLLLCAPFCESRKENSRIHSVVTFLIIKSIYISVHRLHCFVWAHSLHSQIVTFVHSLVTMWTLSEITMWKTRQSSGCSGDSPYMNPGGFAFILFYLLFPPFPDNCIDG